MHTPTPPTRSLILPHAWLSKAPPIHPSTCMTHANGYGLEMKPKSKLDDEKPHVIMLVDMSLSWSPVPYVLMKGLLFSSPIISWPMPISSLYPLQVSPFVWIYGLELKPRPVCVDERPLV